MSEWSSEWALAAVVCLGSLVGGLILASLFRWVGVVDVPNARSLHERATPVGVGVVVPVAVIAAMLASGNGFWPATIVVSVLALIGLIDDIVDLPVGVRFVGQALAGVLGFVQAGAPAGIVALATLALVGAANGLNFMDGINGITATLGLVLGGTLILIAHHVESHRWEIAGAAAVASCLGFLPINFPRGRAFPGDVLPYSLAGIFVVGVVDMSRASYMALFGLAALIPSFLDTSTTLLRRVRSGERITTGHRNHAYQRLARLTSHATSTAAFLGMASFSALAAPIGFGAGWGAGVAYAAMALVVCLVILRRIPIGVP